MSHDPENAPAANMNRGAAPLQAAPAIVVHGIDHARLALRPGLAVVLLSAPAAAAFAGCGWWRAMIDAACAEYPATPASDILDCADAAGLAMAALRHGQRRLILWSGSPGFAAVTAAAATIGAEVIAHRPAAFDLATRDARRRLADYLSNIFT